MATEQDNSLTVTPNGEHFVIRPNDGNAFSILGAFQRNARRYGYSKHQIDVIIHQATRGDYDNLLSTILKYCDIE